MKKKLAFLSEMQEKEEKKRLETEEKIKVDMVEAADREITPTRPTAVYDRFDIPC